MKNLLIIFFGLILTSTAVFAAQGESFTQGINSKRPMIVLLYAPWSPSTQQVVKNMTLLKKSYGAKASFVSIDISTEEAKAYNELLPIQPNLPNIMMFKDKAKISRTISKECTVDYACISKRVSQFIH